VSTTHKQIDSNKVTHVEFCIDTKAAIAIVDRLGWTLNPYGLV
jgi:hypothetical protein